MRRTTILSGLSVWLDIKSISQEVLLTYDSCSCFFIAELQGNRSYSSAKMKRMILWKFSLSGGFKCWLYLCRGCWTVVRETFRGIFKRKPEPDYWQRIKFDWMSSWFFMHFWRSSVVMASCFWPVFPCQWVLGWWPEHSVVCLDLPRTIFTTLAS